MWDALALASTDSESPAMTLAAADDADCHDDNEDNRSKARRQPNRPRLQFQNELKLAPCVVLSMSTNLVQFLQH
jgi:hypothetical protein